MLTAGVSAGTVFPLMLEFGSQMTVSRKKKEAKWEEKADINCLTYFLLTSYKSKMLALFSLLCRFWTLALLYTSPLS